MSQILANNLLTQQFDMKSSKYKMVQQSPQTGGDVAVNTAGGQQVVFEIPPSVYNWSKTRFECTATPSATAAKFNYFQLDGFSLIRTMKLTTRSGVEIFSCDDVAKFTNMVIRRNLNRNKAWSLEDNSFLEGAMVLKDRALTIYRPTVAAGITEIGHLQYITVGGSGTASPVQTISYLFGLLYETIFAEDKSIFLGNDVVYLTITFHASNIPMFAADSATDNTSAPVAYAGSITLSNIKLYLAQDTNIETINMLKSKVASPEGFRLLYKAPIYNKINLNSASQSPSVKYNAALGKRLCAIYHALYHATESSNTAFDHNNLAAAKVTSYYVTINNNRITDLNLTPATYMDYKFYKDSLDGTVMSDQDDYYFNWVIKTDLGAAVSVDQKTHYNPSFDNVIDGMPLTEEIKYDAVLTCVSATYNHYIFGIVQRELLINSNGISIVN